MRRAVRIVLYVGLALTIVVAGLAVYVTWTVRRSFPELDGQLSVPGLAADVDVVRDEHGVPTVYADTPADLFLAQGFVHAQDRFWEMDFRRHVTSGRLAEWFGPDQVETDAFIRTMGWRRVAQAELPLLAPQTRRNLQSYADGVNAYLDQRTGATLSFEHWLLGVVGPGDPPEEWTPVDSLAWLKAMAWDLRGNMQTEAERARLSAVLDEGQLAQLYPDYPYERNAPIVGSGQVRDGVWTASGGGTTADTPITSVSPAAVDPPAAPAGGAAAIASAADRMGRLDAVLGPAGSGVGSNSWVVSGDRTASGAPILANDPHLAPTLPSIWYQMNLRCREVTPACPYDVGGFTFSGFPGVIIGHTSQVAWGFTNLGPDVSDLYVERLRGDLVDTAAGRQPLEIRTETIEVAGEDPVTITVRSTGHGPLISDPEPAFVEDVITIPGLTSAPAGTEYAVALRWTALDPGTTADAVFALDTATTWREFRQAASLFEVPAQNMVYADVDGNIGYQAPGRIPVRASGDGQLPVPGWSGEFDWTGEVPFEALPFELNPDRGYIVTANQAVVGPDYPYLLGDDWAYGHRAQRITDLLEAVDRLDVAAVQTMQMDSRNPNAEFLVPQLPPPSDDPFQAAARALFDGWDYDQPADSAAGAYFNGFWRHLLALTFHDQLPEVDWPDGGDRWFEVVRLIWADESADWWDDVSTPPREQRDDIVATALVDARTELTNRLAKDPQRWEWGRLHQLDLEHQPFGTLGIAVIERLFNRGPLELGGGGALVDATAWNAANGYDVVWVPSMRMVVDLADLDGSTWVNLTGQSGHPYDRTYTDQAELWRDGAQLGWAWSPQAVATTARNRLTLVPDGLGAPG